MTAEVTGSTRIQRCIASSVMHILCLGSRVASASATMQRVLVASERLLPIGAPPRHGAIERKVLMPLVPTCITTVPRRQSAHASWAALSAGQVAENSGTCNCRLGRRTRLAQSARLPCQLQEVQPRETHSIQAQRYCLGWAQAQLHMSKIMRHCRGLQGFQAWRGKLTWSGGDDDMTLLALVCSRA